MRCLFLLDLNFFHDACNQTALLAQKIQNEIKVDLREKMNFSWLLVINGLLSIQYPLIGNSLKINLGETLV